MTPDTVRRAACLIAAGLALAGSEAALHAQSAGGEAVRICSSVSGAKCTPQPAASTPVAPAYRESYAAYLDLKSKARGGTIYKRADYAKMPDWSGVWSREDLLKFDPAAPGGPFSGETTAPLTPKYEAAFRAKIRDVRAGKEWDQLSDCLPSGYPRWLTEPFLREFIVTPQMTWMMNEQQSETRRIYTDGRGHLPADQATPLWTGDSIGFWDGDTLVAHTISVTHGSYQRQEPDYSASTSTVERIRLTSPDTLEDDVTVWDPKGLRKPWHVVIHFARVTLPNTRVDMWSCEQNNNVIRTPAGGSQFILPGETVTVQRAYRDPDSFYLTDEQKKLFEDELAGGK